MRLALPQRHLECVPGRPLLMGIVNANPDSFSDARRLETLDAQLAEALAQVRAGADIIDVGGESGVTYTGLTAEEVEIGRVAPLVAQRVRVEPHRLEPSSTPSGMKYTSPGAP